MALIKPICTKTVGVKIKFPKQLDGNIKAYMQWVGIDAMSIFFQQAAEYILEHDKQWKSHKSQH
jgi:hypothetical protein